MPTPTRMRLPLSVAMVAFALVGCSAEQEELTQWMEQQRREVKPNVQPLSPPKKFTPQPYTALSGVEPFSNQKLTVALKQEARQPNSLLAAEINRRKEPLEAFPLEQLKMVGTLSQGKDTYALVRAERTLYRVKKGNYMGQNFGLITDVTESEIKLKEIVQDSAGDWAERQSVLPLLEETGKGDKK